MKYPDMLQFLQGRKVDIKKLDNGPKNLLQLHKEIMERDVKLDYDRKTRRVLRVAMSVKILITAGGFQLHEVAREYQDGTILKKFREWSISETRKREELVPDAVVRGLSEECQLVIHPNQLKLWHAPDEIDRHESSVYRGVVSAVFIQRVSLDLPERPWAGDDKVFVDDGVKIYTRWFDLR